MIYKLKNNLTSTERNALLHELLEHYYVNYGSISDFLVKKDKHKGLFTVGSVSLDLKIFKCVNKEQIKKQSKVSLPMITKNSFVESRN